ncbi:histidinol-phosphatase [Desulfopila aestuarii]|uniref:Histidinol-phosphatase n=1 Tax=Desulfopila aestuarii DSM 18488 TaxID=1121416 RepID=A0A1M7Y540_9BACT|nr:histidinol-phosphatase [Desulfopila aestuarii]SHO47317.1 histidinol-phosphatase (PHP family) [Desulfopila aestuarii DSM 18488]
MSHHSLPAACPIDFMGNNCWDGNITHTSKGQEVMSTAQYVSVHGGHSGQFCYHAKDTLEEIIQSYISHGFPWVGITEHVPGITMELLYPDQQKAGFTPASLLERFDRYMQECRRLKQKYADQIDIYAAMEIETYSGYDTFIPNLIERYRPDYIVGSIHFVNDMVFDYSRERYDLLAETVGGHDELYSRYFDMQYEMIELLRPEVVGHFDLIRIFDPYYKERLRKPEIEAKVIRNLELIKKYNLIMDFNIRSLLKGADEPYITAHILQMAKDLDIAVVPGDDSHGLDNIHINMDKAISILKEYGFATNWRKPRRIHYD